MRFRKWWIALCIVHILCIIRINAQDKDTTLIQPIGNKINELQPQLAPLSNKQLKVPEVDFQEITAKPKRPVFNYTRELKLVNAEAANTSDLFLPTYPGVGDSKIFGGKLGSYCLSDNLTFDYSAFINAQYGYLFSSKQILAGNKVLLSYAITNKLQLQTWGQYLMPGTSSDPTFNLPVFFPKSNFGAGLQYDSHKNTKVKVGIEYQYDQSDKSWKAESGGKVLLKF